MPARKKTDAQEAVDAGSNTSTSTHLVVVDSTIERQHNETQQLLVAEFGDGLPWHPDHYEAEIRGELRRGCEAFLRAGRLLLVAKGCAPHGEWSAMVGRLGMEARQAQRMMEAARRVASLPNAASAAQLIEASKTSSKLIELLSLPEDQFSELAEGGETNGLRLDDVASMGVRELRDALREAREDIEAKNERAAKREADIERLQKNLRKVKRDADQATPDEILADLRTRCQMAAIQVRANLSAEGDGVDSLRTRIRELLDHDSEDQGDFLAGLIGELLTQIRIVRDEFGLPIVNDKAPR